MPFICVSLRIFFGYFLIFKNHQILLLIFLLFLIRLVVLDSGFKVTQAIGITDVVFRSGISVSGGLNILSVLDLSVATDNYVLGFIKFYSLCPIFL